MNTYRKSAITVGILYLTANIAGALSLPFSESYLNASDYLEAISANANQVVTGGLLVLIMTVALVGMAITMYPLLKKHSEALALGYVAARIVEGLIYIIGVISLLTLVILSQEYVKAGAPAASHYQTVGELLRAVRDYGAHAVLDVAVFPVGALILYYLLYQSKLVPRWLAGWGFLATLVYLAAGMLVMFALISPMSTTQVVLNLPLAVQEMVFAIWLIVKGFNPSGIVSESVDTDERPVVRPRYRPKSI